LVGEEQVGSNQSDARHWIEARMRQQNSAVQPRAIRKQSLAASAALRAALSGNRPPYTNSLKVNASTRLNGVAGFGAAITASKTIRACGWREDAQPVAAASSAEAPGTEQIRIAAATSRIIHAPLR
jgi:hypothetical protein